MHAWSDVEAFCILLTYPQHTWVLSR